MTRLRQIQTDEPLLFKETNIDNIIVSLLNARSAKHHFPDILEDPILLSADIICLTEANFYSGDNMEIDKYNCTKLPMDTNSKTHGIMICVKESLKTEVIRVVKLPIAELSEIKIQTSLTSISIVLLYRSPSSSDSVFVNDLHLLHPLSASEHAIICGDCNVNRNTPPSLYEKVVQHFKTNDLQQCVTFPTTIYGSTLYLVFTGGHLPSIIYNGCYYSDHMTLLLQKKIQ